MTGPSNRAICWTPVWNKDRHGIGLEHLLLAEHSADGVVLAFDSQGPFRLAYQLSWDGSWQLHEARLTVTTAQSSRSLALKTDCRGHWRRGDSDHTIDVLDGCMDVDIWPTPFTNSFPIRREPMAVGERRQFLTAWICAPDLTMKAQPQAYTRLADRLYLFESLDGGNFQAEISVDEDGIVLDYPELFRRVS